MLLLLRLPRQRLDDQGLTKEVYYINNYSTLSMLFFIITKKKIALESKKGKVIKAAKANDSFEIGS